MTASKPLRGAFTAIALVVSHQAIAGDDGKVAVIGYASNYNSFTFYKESYKSTHAEAASLEDALKGRWRNAVSVVNLHIRDGLYERFERDRGAAGLPKPPAVKTNPDGKTETTVFTSTMFANEKYLSGEKGSLLYHPGVNTADLIDYDDPTH